MTASERSVPRIEDRVRLPLLVLGQLEVVATVVSSQIVCKLLVLYHLLERAEHERSDCGMVGVQDS